jgi:hypothetical protein
MKQDWKVGVPPTKCRIVRRRTLPPRGKSAENPWHSHFSRNRAPPHRRHRFAARKICATRFASSLPQDSSVQLMFEPGGFGRRSLSRSLRLEFCAAGAALARRVVADAAQVPLRMQDFARM